MKERERDERWRATERGDGHRMMEANKGGKTKQQQTNKKGRQGKIRIG